MIQTTEGEERERAISASKEFLQMNCDMAQQKAASTLTYFCVGCAHMANGMVPNDAEQHKYAFDIITDKLEGKDLRIPPTTAGYFEGCHTKYYAIFPDARLGWERYRQLLGRIEGLKIVDIPNNMCCSKYADRIVEAAEKQKLDTVICSCNACFRRIGTAGGDRVQTKYLAEVLLQALGNE